MVRTRRLIAVLAAALTFMGCAPADQPSDAAEKPVDLHAVHYPGLSNPLEEVPALLSIEDYLALRSASANTVLIDVRKPADYAAGHLAGALQLWRTDLEITAYPYAGMAIGKDELAALLRDKGVAAGSQMVIYDGVGGCDAARLWWLLATYGYRKVSLLDGGWMAWQHDALPWETVLPTSQGIGDFRFADAPRTDLAIDYTGLREAMQRDSIVLLDTRSMEEFNGTTVKDGASYGGHIPGSVHYDWGNAVDMNNDYRLKPHDELKAQLEALGVSPKYHIVAYCHSGVRAAHTTFVLKELLGYPRVSNYDGSWIEWSYLTDEEATEIGKTNNVH
jgi:thiosulfate/3-mercaptopyruvate sulfurtransferase